MTYRGPRPAVDKALKHCVEGSRSLLFVKQYNEPTLSLVEMERSDVDEAMAALRGVRQMIEEIMSARRLIDGRDA
eukprot:CAMPEP_0174696898 /NCGR_PEP_ID=MMETSP1094-20130205/2918_1 /TAXON_ID=156173 /ORGANISM="Chrysochromulina brevifilum, Strain UTEX LB 985" /LENGTH=74 /DNA_ID=CAMNT_0015893769 /DNA_START=389 /DNA_END=614 /DNA_ORIENTATION=-